MTQIEVAGVIASVGLILLVVVVAAVFAVVGLVQRAKEKAPRRR